jgi:hypothetical protein
MALTQLTVMVAAAPKYAATVMAIVAIAAALVAKVHSQDDKRWNK